MKARFRELVDAAAWRPAPASSISFSGGAMTMKQNRTLEARWVANAAAYGIADQGPDPNSGSTDMGQRELVLPDDPPRAGDRAGGHAGPFDPVPRRCRDPGRRRDDAPGRDARRQTAYELSPITELVAAAWREFHGADGAAARRTGRPWSRPVAARGGRPERRRSRRLGRGDLVDRAAEIAHVQLAGLVLGRRS